MRHFLYVALFGLFAISPSLAAQKDYNGRWAVFATTDRGQCVKDFKLSVRISKGMAYVVGRSVTGKKTAVNSNGKVDIIYIDGKDIFTANGSLKDRDGSGIWTYPTFRCAGRWHAQRK